MKHLFTSLGFVVLLAGALFAMACGNDKESKSTATPQATSTTTSATSGATGTPAGQAPAAAGCGSAGGQTPVQGTLGTPAGQATLVHVGTTTTGPSCDRIAFEFSGGSAGYTVEYVTAPADCGSGFPTFPNPGQGTAFLQVKFTPAVAHDIQGVTVNTLDLVANLPEIIEAKRSCDFEGIVTWEVLVSQMKNFRVLTQTNPLGLLVDIEH